MVTINILTRTGTRKCLYTTLKTSILSQTYPNIKHIVSCDNPMCDFLDEEKHVVTVKKSQGVKFYNLYLNDLAKAVTSGWVIILDDDLKLLDNTFISKLAEVCKQSEPNDVLIYQVKLGKNGGKLPNDWFMKHQKFKRGGIDMACFCVHHSVFNHHHFERRSCADYYFLDSLRKSNNFNFKYVTDLPLGMWANYEGPRGGRN